MIGGLMLPSDRPANPAPEMRAARRHPLAQLRIGNGAQVCDTCRWRAHTGTGPAGEILFFEDKYLF
jgi:hypothetical protein